MNFDYTPLYNKAARYLTLGCKLNFCETATLRAQLEAHGVRTLGDTDAEGADICVLNTCSVTDVADQKGRQMMRRLRRENPQALLVVMGCYAQLQPKRIWECTIKAEGLGLKAEKCTIGADAHSSPLTPHSSSEEPHSQERMLIVGTEHKGQIAELIVKHLTEEADTLCPPIYHTSRQEIQTFTPSCSRGDRTRWFLKVQDGCNYFCTYCTIPAARGRSRNGSIASLLEQAKAVAAQGGKEIVITGVNTGDFGRSTGERFLELLQRLDEVEEIERYRISSIEPNLLTDEIIDFCAHSRAFMPHFHLPLQCGDDEVLRLMHRHYDTSLFRERCERILMAMPDAFIGVDVIVGMRGETAERFEASASFIESLPVAQLHVFPYSERPGTRALEIPHCVTKAGKHARAARLIAISEQKHEAFRQRFAGTVRPVLWERAAMGAEMSGWTDNYLRVPAHCALDAAEENRVSEARIL